MTQFKLQLFVMQCVFGVVFLSIPLVGCNTERKQEEAKIRDVLNDYVRAWNAYDVKGVMMTVDVNSMNLDDYTTFRKGFEEQFEQWEQIKTQRAVLSVTEVYIRQLDLSEGVAVVDFTLTYEVIGGKPSHSKERRVSSFLEWQSNGEWKFFPLPSMEPYGSVGIFSEIER